jgi:hypothetical protein
MPRTGRRPGSSYSSPGRHIRDVAEASCTNDPSRAALTRRTIRRKPPGRRECARRSCRVPITHRDRCTKSGSPLSPIPRACPGCRSSELLAYLPVLRDAGAAPRRLKWALPVRKSAPAGSHPPWAAHLGDGVYLSCFTVSPTLIVSPCAARCWTPEADSELVLSR